MRLALPFHLTPFLLLSKSIQAQIDTSTTYEKDTIGFHGNKYILNGKILSFKKLAPYLNSYPESAKEYKIAKTNRIISTYLFVGVLVAITASIAMKDVHEDLTTGFLIVGVTYPVIAIPLAIKAKKKTRHAVWLYNRNILSK